MNQCYNSGDFYKYFKENMDDLGVYFPVSLFKTYGTALATATTLVGTLHVLGKRATIAELVGATIGVEKLMVASAFGAAAYTGVIIGSIAVATFRVASCGSRISDMFLFLSKNKLEFNGWREFYTQNPEIFDKNDTNRIRFGLKARHIKTT